MPPETTTTAKLSKAASLALTKYNTAKNVERLGHGESPLSKHEELNLIILNVCGDAEYTVYTTYTTEKRLFSLDELEHQVSNDTTGGL